MEVDSEVIEETPDLNFSEGIAEQETSDINFSEINDQETPDIDFGDDLAESAANAIEELANENSDIDDLDEPDQYIDESAANNNSESDITSKNDAKAKEPSENRLVHLPTARVKHIMKADPDVSLITGECTFLVTKATELFIESLAQEAFLHTAQAKKKTVQKRDVDAAIENVESLMFLEGMMNI